MDNENLANEQVDESYAVNQQVAENQAQDQQTEKMLSQSEVNHLIAANKKSSYERGYSAASVQSKNNVLQHNATYQSQAKSQGFDQNQVQEMVQAQIKTYAEQQQALMQQQQLQQQARDINDQVLSKNEDAKQRYDDFDTVVDNDFLSEYADVVIAANDVDNTGDVLYHLKNDPVKLGSIRLLGKRERAAAIKKFSTSIINNQNSLRKDLPRSPLSQTKPSNVGYNNGKPTMNDFRNNPAFRG